MHGGSQNNDRQRLDSRGSTDNKLPDTDEWVRRYNDMVEKAPLCKCGCGIKVSCCKGSSPEAMRKNHTVTIHYAKYRPNHHWHRRGWNTKFNTVVLGKLVGTLLGDGCIALPYKGAKTPRLSWNHGPKQRAWLKYKMRNLDKSLHFTYTEIPNGGWGKITCHGLSCAHAELSSLYKLAYPRGVKTVTRELLDMLTDEGVAWWFCDDGSGASSQCQLCTHGFSKREQELIRTWFKEKYNISFKVQQDKRRKLWYLRAGLMDWLRLKAVIQPYIPASMRYKLRDSVKRHRIASCKSL